MKIAIWHNLPSGGGKRALFDQVKGLVKRGHHVEVWCPPSADQSFLPLRDMVREHILDLPAVAVRPEGRIRAKLYDATVVSARMKSMEEHCRNCASEMTRDRFDVVFAHPCRFFRTSPIAQFTGLPSVLYLQEPFRELYEASPQLPWRASARKFNGRSPSFWRFFVADALELSGKREQVREEHRWASAFDQILVNSFYSRESIVRTYNLDARVCYLGIDTEEFFPDGSEKRPYVIGLGNIYFNKRPDFAIRCIAAMRAEGRPKLVWVGNFGDEGWMHSAAAAAGVELETHVLIPQAQLRTLLSGAAAMLFTPHLEPFGYAPLEANACGTVVVALAEGGVRETVGNSASGVLVNNLEAAAFAEALAPFCADLGYADRAGRAARRYVETTWSLDAAEARLERELRRAIALRNLPA